MKLSTIAKMITESKVPQYTDIINIAKTTALGHDSILWSPSKQQFTVKKNIIGREVPKQF